MTAKELRIEDYNLYNYIKCGNSVNGNIYRILSIDGLNEQVMLNGLKHGEWYDIKDLTPIPLTDEVLGKIEGFEESGDNEHWFIGHFGFCLWYDGQDWCMLLNVGDDRVIAYCRYLHQLQNLFYCLTQTELKIEL